MAQDTRVTLDLASQRGAPPPPEPAPDVSVLDLFKRIYQFFYSKTVGLIIILAMAVLVLAGVVIGQAPAGTYDDAAAKAQFLGQAQEKYGGWSGIMDFLGLFRVFSSPLFLTVTALLALSIIACTVHRIPQLWQRYRHPHTHVTDQFFERARYRAALELPEGVSDPMARLDGQLRAKHWRVIVDGKDPDHSRYVDRFAWGGFGTVLAHLSFIIILASFVISGSGGIDETLNVPVGGDPVDVGHDTGLSVSATSFEDTYTDEGRPIDYVSHLVVRSGDQVVGEQDVRVNSPLQVGAVRFHQATFGIAADVSVMDANGASVYQGSVPLQWTTDDGANSVGSISLPDLGYQVQVITAASGTQSSSLAAGEAAFQLFRAGQAEPITMVKAEQGIAAELGDLKVTFQRERSYTGIMVRQNPGAIWMWIGCALLVIGMTLTFACRHRRIWVRFEPGKPGRLRFASADKEDLSFEKLFTDLALDVAARFEKEPTTVKEARRD